MPACATCGAENPTGQKFCGDCGHPLAAVCAECGSANPPGQRFCGECGARLPDGGPTPVEAPAGQPALVAERRLVSVLFADLVGFTALSERRDAEEVRELLSRYFDTCKRLISLYGGTVEKFIGDAVMAVWGTPVATEDDAERGVRAALDLVAAVAELGDEVGWSGLQARAGVLTGEAAVTLGATGEGMVAGDLVNTASRIQSVAEPGCVLVGEATRRASEGAIAYEPVGEEALKGKAETVPLWRALRVVSGVGGELRSERLEAPFVGRDRELRQIKDLFHVSADEGRAQLVSVTGIAGIGKSRLAWEFYKYFDGLKQLVYWHRGRCLAYGEGVAYWALADMVRMRCRIAEDDEPAAALQKLRAALDEHVLDAEERRFVEPRLSVLLGLGGQEAAERQDLFAAWRLFFERLADAYPTVLVFEDMQWADAGLLDFVEYLLDWSRNHPLYVVTLARPELLESRPTWGAGHRNFVSLYLEPLSEQAMGRLVDGLVPGLPAALRTQILARAEGVPLYAVETVRMLLDRELLVEEGSAYRVVGEVASLEVPETLQALVAARLDGLSPDERRLLQDAAVLGKTFTPAALAALAGLDPADVEPLLATLVRKEVLGLQSDPRSPEAGQYGFLQDIIRRVAYETLPKRERRARHLAAAEHLSASVAEDEVAEVVASHLLEAYRLDPAADDAPALRAKAHAALLRAAERAASLGGSDTAQRSFEQAAELAEGPAGQAAALARAGETAIEAGAGERARPLLVRAAALYEEAGELHAAARASTFLAMLDQVGGRVHEGIARMEAALGAIADDEPDADLAFLLARLGQAHYFAGDPERAAGLTERALDLAEALGLPEILCRGWTLRAATLAPTRPEEARGLLRLALETAEANELHQLAANALGNLSDNGFRRDDYADSVEHLERQLELARRIGNRPPEWFALSELTYALTMLGRWDEALARLAEIPDEQLSVNTQLTSPVTGVLELHLARGEVEQSRELLARFEQLGRSGDIQAQSGYAVGEAALRLAEGRPGESLAAAERALSARESLGIAAQDVKDAFRLAVEAALALEKREQAAELLTSVERLPVGLQPPILASLARRFRARLAGASPEAEAHFAAAVAGLRRLALPFHLAVVQLEQAEWLSARGRAGEAEPQLAEARTTFERLRAAPWLERLDGVSARGRAEIPV